MIRNCGIGDLRKEKEKQNKLAIRSLLATVVARLAVVAVASPHHIAISIIRGVVVVVPIIVVVKLLLVVVVIPVSFQNPRHLTSNGHLPSTPLLSYLLPLAPPLCTILSEQ